MVRITVRNPVSGKACELPELPDESTVREVKAEVQQQWQVPDCCQRLVLSGRTLLDAEQLPAVCSAEELASGVSIDLLVTTTLLMEHLAGSAKQALTALQILRKWKREGMQDVIGAVLELCASTTFHKELRASAMATLPSIVGCGGEAAAAALGPHLHHDTPRRRLRGALHALPELVEKGNKAGVAVLVELLGEVHDRADEAADIEDVYLAMSALGRVAARGDEAAVGALVERLRDERPRVRAGASDLLAEVAELGHGASATALLALLDDASASVRSFAVDALRRLSRPWDEAILPAILPRLRDEDGAVRQSAAEAVAALAAASEAPPGCDGAPAVEALCERLEADVALEVRCAAATALGSVAARGHEEAVLRLVQSLHCEAGCWRARCAVAAALAEVAEEGCEHAVGALEEVAMSLRFRFCQVMASDSVPEVRKAVKAALCKLTGVEAEEEEDEEEAKEEASLCPEPQIAW